MDKNGFLSQKLSRAIWYALIMQNRVQDAISEYGKYITSLKEQFTNTKEAEAEIEYSKNLFLEKLKSKYDEYIGNKDYYNALLCCKFVFENNADDEKNIINYIKCLELLKQYDLQVLIAKYYLYAFKKNKCYKLLSEAYSKNKDYELSTEYYKRYLYLEHKTQLDAGDYNTIGCNYFYSYINKGENPEDAKNALKYFLKTIQLCPDSKAYIKNGIVSAMKVKNFKIEKALWQKYLSYGYADKDDEYTYCASCFRECDFEEWAKYYNSRFYTKNPTIYPKFDKPEWTGNEDLSDKTLLVHYEQGFGDNFLMFGYMPRLVKMAKHVIYYIQNEIYELVKDNEYGVEIQCHNTCDAQKLDFDYHIPCMAIPIALKLNKDNMSVIGGYIHPKQELVKEFKDKYFNTDKYKIGIAFGGSASSEGRNIPVENLLQLDELDNVQIYCFTKDIDDSVLAKFKKNKVINIAKNFGNFADTAAALENLDILVSSDNGVLNLAGAIGKKTLGVFHYHYVFRWYDLSGDDCGWFKCVKPIVNNEYNDWKLSMEKVVDIIRKETMN